MSVLWQSDKIFTLGVAMKSVWKFPLILNDDISVELQKGAEILYLAVQNGTACLWACVDPAASVEIRHFKLRGTGHNVGPDCGKHIGSFMLGERALVFHLFEAA